MKVKKLIINIESINVTVDDLNNDLIEDVEQKFHDSLSRIFQDNEE